MNISFDGFSKSSKYPPLDRRFLSSERHISRETAACMVGGGCSWVMGQHNSLPDHHSLTRRSSDIITSSPSDADPISYSAELNKCGHFYRLLSFRPLASGRRQRCFGE